MVTLTSRMYPEITTSKLFRTVLGSGVGKARKKGIYGVGAQSRQGGGGTDEV